MRPRVPAPSPAGWAIASGSQLRALALEAGSTPAMRTRSAALGTFSTLSRASVTTRTLAVMPGSSRPPVLEKPTTTT